MFEHAKNIAVILGLATALFSAGAWLIKPHAAEFVTDTVQNTVEKLESGIAQLRLKGNDTGIRIDQLATEQKTISAEQQVIQQQNLLIIDLLRAMQIDNSSLRTPDNLPPIR